MSVCLPPHITWTPRVQTTKFSVVGYGQWRNKVAVGLRASIPKEPPLPPKTFKKQRQANFGPPTALGPRALHALHALLLRHWLRP